MNKTVRRLLLVSIIALLATQLDWGGIADAVIPRSGMAEGAWSWFGDPRAVRANGRTYFAWINAAGHAQIGAFPDGGGIDQVSTLKASLGADDHNNPGILVRDSDSKILAFYSGHSATEAYMRISSNAEDVSTFATEVALDASLAGNNYTYMSPIQLTGEANDPIYLIYRDRATTSSSSDSQWAFSTSTDGGATWATRTVLYSNGANGPYLKAVANGTTRIDFVVTNAHPITANPSIYHFYYSGGSYYQTDGTLIGDGTALPLEPADLTLVYDGTTTPGWLWDIAIDGSGHPVIVYATFPTTTDHRYNYARWNGSAWSNNEIVAGGTYLYAAQANYSGGVVLDHANVNNVYVSRQVNSQWEIYKYTTADSGSTWTGTAITTNSRHKNIRPVVPRNAGGGVNVMWLQGSYTTYEDYELNIVGSSQ